MGCGVVERHLEMAKPTKKTILIFADIDIVLYFRHSRALLIMVGSSYYN